MPDWQHRILSRWRSTVPAARTPRFRSVLDRFTAYKPGRVPVSPHGRSFKLSSNESPSGPLPSVVEVITAAAADVNRYPDNHAQALTGAISTRFGVPPEHVAVGCGSVGLTQQLLEAAAEPGGHVLYAWRSFEAYPLLADLSGAASVRVPLRDERHDLAAMAGAITEHTRVVFVCNPNNPTGTAVRRDELEEFLDRVPPDCLVVLDEAYREYVRDPGVPDGLSLYPGRPNVAVLRTFSKAYGLAGLRVGFLVAAEPVAAAVRMTMLPFTVNHLAQAAAVASLAAEPELLDRVDAVVGERGRVRGALISDGWSVPPTEANFVWLPLGEDTAHFAAECEAAGVSIRPFGAEGARVSIGDPEANEAFLAVAKAYPRRH
jgi:histidinol-phosphate aminotransferase